MAANLLSHSLECQRQRLPATALCRVANTAACCPPPARLPNRNDAGFKRSNVIIISQPRRSGYRYHPQTGRFVTGAQSSAAVPSETVGSGLAAMQLNWHPDAFVLSEEGLIHGLRDTALEVLTQRGVRWMASYRSRDLMLLEKESLLAPKFLAQAMWLHARDGTNIVTQVGGGVAGSLEAAAGVATGTNDCAD